MRRFALVSLFLMAALATFRATASAQTPDFLQVSLQASGQTSDTSELIQPSVLEVLTPEPEPTLPPTPVVEVKKYIVVESDSLSSVADKYATTWKRLYDKNTLVENPDAITIGQELIIPAPEEVLPERPLPTPSTPDPALQPKAASNLAAKSAARPVAPRPASSAGNTYTYGYCTWYAKNKRPDLPNNLGNADTWVARAAAQGIPTGSAPRVGAIGQQGMHVVYVESVNGDGTVTISEMNYEGYGVVSSRTVPAGFFKYIY